MQAALIERDEKGFSLSWENGKIDLIADNIDQARYAAAVVFSKIRPFVDVPEKIEVNRVLSLGFEQLEFSQIGGHVNV